MNTAEPTADLSQSFTVIGLPRAQLLNSAFQIRVRATRGNNNTAFTASLDAVSVRVAYTAPGTSAISVNAVRRHDRPRRRHVHLRWGADGTRLSVRNVGC